MAPPFVIGVTGGIACGKSTVMRALADLGAETIDADAVYHELIAPRSPLWRALRDQFGDGIIANDATIDRPALAGIVFANADALADLDRITHPVVTAEIRQRLAVADSPVVAIDAVKLVESGLDQDCGRVWVVTCDRSQQIARLVVRNNLALAEATRRVDAQASQHAARARADLVIDNSNDRHETVSTVREAWNDLFPNPTLGPDRSAPTPDDAGMNDNEPGVDTRKDSRP